MADKIKAAKTRPKKGWVGSGKRPPADPTWASRMAKRKKARAKKRMASPKTKAAIDAFVEAKGSTSEALRILEERGAPTKGTMLLTRNNPVRQAAEAKLQEILDAAGVDPVRTLTEVRRIAYSDVRHLYRDDGSLREPHELSDDAAAAISSVKVKIRRYTSRSGDDEEEETREIKAWDKNSALKDLLRVQRLMPEQHEHSGPKGGPIPIDGPQESRSDIMASLLAMVKPKGDPK